MSTNKIIFEKDRDDSERFYFESANSDTGLFYFKPDDVIITTNLYYLNEPSEFQVCRVEVVG